jgi:hypothetical protein
VCVCRISIDLLMWTGTTLLAEFHQTFYFTLSRVRDSIYIPYVLHFPVSIEHELQ